MKKIIIGIGVLALILSLSSSLAIAAKGDIGFSCLDDGTCNGEGTTAECVNGRCVALPRIVGAGDDCDKDPNAKHICGQGLTCSGDTDKDTEGIEKDGICQSTSYSSIDCKPAEGTENTKADSVLCRVLSTLSIVFALVLVLAVLYFVWGVVQYVTAGGDEEKSAAGKKTMMFGIIALVVIAAVAGIMSIITNYMDIDNAIKLPFIG